MTNLKKSLSLILALAMLAGFMVIAPAALAADVELPVVGVTVAAGASSGIDITVTFANKLASGDAHKAKYIIATAEPTTDSPTPAAITALAADATSSVTNVAFTGLTALTSYRVYVANDGSFLTGGADLVSEAFILVADDSGTLKFGGFGSNINYAASAQKVTATSAAYESGVVAGALTLTAANFEIDLVKETLKIPEKYGDTTTALSIAAYSLDGGSKWKAGSIGSKDGADISKFLNKGMELVLVTKFDKKAKGVDKGKEAVVADAANNVAAADAVAGGMTIKFPAIAARPKTDKLTANYGIDGYTDLTAKTAGRWILSAKNATDAADVTALQIAVAGSDKKNPDAAGWGVFKATDGGINVKTTTGAKPEKIIYLVRNAPKAAQDGTAVPASKPIKVTVSSTLAAPKLKADYKKEIIKTKADMIAKLGTDLPASNAVAKPLVMDKEAAKMGLSFAGELGLADTYAIAYSVATAKKPASSIQTITLAKQARFDDSSVTVTKGKAKIDKKFEMLVDASSGKHGGIKIDTAAKPTKIDKVRLKNTAKATKEGGYQNLAASEYGTLHLTWGKDDKDKDIVESAVLIGPDYKDGKMVLYPKSTNEYATLNTSGAVFVSFGIKNAVTGLDAAAAKAALVVTLKAVDAETNVTVEAAASDPGYYGHTLPELKVVLPNPGELLITDIATPAKTLFKTDVLLNQAGAIAVMGTTRHTAKATAAAANSAGTFNITGDKLTIGTASGSFESDISTFADDNKIFALMKQLNADDEITLTSGTAIALLTLKGSADLTVLPVGTTLTAVTITHTAATPAGTQVKMNSKPATLTLTGAAKVADAKNDTATSGASLAATNGTTIAVASGAVTLTGVGTFGTSKAYYGTAASWAAAPVKTYIQATSTAAAAFSSIIVGVE